MTVALEVPTLEASTNAPRPGLTPPPEPRIPAADRLLSAWAALVLVAFSTVVYGVFWAPKAALVLLVLVPGAVALWAAARARTPGARAAVAFLAAALVSTLLADRVWLSLLGAHNWGTGWLFLVGLAGTWALGTRMSTRGVRQLETAILAGSLACAAFAWVQMGVDLPVRTIDDVGGRAGSLLGNPVHLGSLAAAATWLSCTRLREGSRVLPHLAGVAVLAGAVQLSGSRVGLLPLGVIGMVWLWRLRWRRAAAFALAVVLGLGGAAMVSRAAGAPEESATGRAAVSLDPGSSGRSAVWRAGIEGSSERPFLGSGPARLQTVVTPRVDAVAQRYTDGHNLVVHYGVTTGVVGLALLVGWLVAAGRRVRGPLAGFVAVAGLATLAQPLSVAVTPVAALALGAGGRRTDPPTIGAGGRRIIAFGSAVAVIVAGVFLAGQVYLARGEVDASPVDVARADSLLPPWPEVASVGWRVKAFEAISERSDAAWAEALDLAREAVRRDPAVPQAWANLGDLALRQGDRDLARHAYEQALVRHPWTRRALWGSVYFAASEGDTETVDELCARLAAVSDVKSDCAEQARQIYERKGYDGLVLS